MTTHGQSSPFVLQFFSLDNSYLNSSFESTIHQSSQTRFQIHALYLTILSVLLKPFIWYLHHVELFRRPFERQGLVT